MGFEEGIANFSFDIMVRYKSVILTTLLGVYMGGIFILFGMISKIEER